MTLSQEQLAIGGDSVPSLRLCVCRAEVIRRAIHAKPIIEFEIVDVEAPPYRIKPAIRAIIAVWLVVAAVTKPPTTTVFDPPVLARFGV